MRFVSRLCLLQGILIAVIFHSQADIPEKRFVAALAKNGRLPKFSTVQKKDSRELSSTEDSYPKDETQMEYPNSILSEDKRRAFFESVISGKDSSAEAKRNVATLARLGRLNAIRYGSLQSRLTGAKRINNDPNASIKESNDEDNDINIIGEIDCHDDNDDQVIEMTPNWQKKRYVAALARSGRLPIWHSQRMWGAGKRDETYPYGDDSRYNGDNDDVDNTIDETAHVTPKYKRCKKIYGFETEKRSIATLAKNEKIPLNTFQDDKRNIQAIAQSGNLSFSNYQDEKRNIQAMARNGNLPFNNYQNEKRNIQAMARNGKLKFSDNQGDKRNVQAMARNGKLPSFRDLDEKRIVHDMTWNGNLPFSDYQNEKRNIQAMARNGNLPFNNYQNGKRNIQAMARNGNLPFNNYQNGKRNIQAMARNGKLKFSDNQGDKRNVQSMARNGKLPSFSRSDEKRNVQAMARNGKLPSFSYIDDKRNIQALALNEDSQSQDEKQALARKGLLTSFGAQDGNQQAMAQNLPFTKMEDIKQKLLYNSYENEKRTIQAMARNGKFRLNSYPNGKRSNEDENTADFQEYKRNLAALARKGKLPLSHMKRNLAAMARNGKLPFNKYPTMKREEDESDWDDNINDLQEDNVVALNGKQSYRENKHDIAVSNGMSNGNGKLNIEKGMLPIVV